jgi:hypothetical protein
MRKTHVAEPEPESVGLVFKDLCFEPHTGNMRDREFESFQDLMEYIDAEARRRIEEKQH